MVSESIEDEQDHVQDPVATAKRYFPFDGYREYQEDILEEATAELFDTGAKTVVIEGPPGIGKSPINMALGNVAPGDAFYTTPQKKLRDQLQNDDDLAHLHAALRARRDYICDSVPSHLERSDEEFTCESCPVNNSPDKACRNRGCRYWKAKEAAMHSSVATLTFAFLILDNRVPTTMKRMEGGGVKDVQISFGERELLIIDEAHTLEEQCASLHAGAEFGHQNLDTKELAYYDASASTNSDLPRDVRKKDTNPYAEFIETMREVMNNQPRGTEVDDLSIEQVIPVVDAVYEAVTDKVEAMDELELNDVGGGVKNEFESLAWKLSRAVNQVQSGEPWVLEGEELEQKRYRLEIKPVYVDDFLQNNVWNRADKVVLSTATLPYRNNPEKWLERIGRDPSTAAVIKKPMPFPAENRPIRTDYQIGSMSSDGVKEHWDDIVASVEMIAQQHSGEKGLVHTVSYARAARLSDELPNLTMYHNPNEDRDAAAWIEKWQRSDKQIFLTPAMTEGVDLYDDRCRFQILLKAPYRNLNDPRVDYLINEEDDWEWYHDVTAREIIQSVGRAVRSPDDYATYYVLDTKFDQALNGRKPQWFENAIVG